MNRGSPIGDWAFDIAKKYDIRYNFSDEEIRDLVCCYMNWFCYIEEHMQSLVSEIRETAKTYFNEE